MTTFTAQEMVDAVEREIKLRRRVYRNRVNTHRMSKAQADYQVRIMEAIRDRLQFDVGKERLL